MRALGRNYFERQFLRHAKEKLPLSEAEISRNGWGVLTCGWSAPCAEIGSLWVNVTRYEIVLSNAISHEHFGKSLYAREGLTSRILKRRIAREAAEQAKRFLDGEIFATKAFDAEGGIHSTGLCEARHLPTLISEYKAVFGDGFTNRAWNWFGEVDLTPHP
jgi:hypothetical protein